MPSDLDSTTLRIPAAAAQDPVERLTDQLAEACRLNSELASLLDGRVTEVADLKDELKEARQRIAELEQERR